MFGNSQRWEELSKSIELVDNNRLDNPNIALDAAKTILEKNRSCF
jgi:hypothetical protein